MEILMFDLTKISDFERPWARKRLAYSRVNSPPCHAFCQLLLQGIAGPSTYGENSQQRRFAGILQTNERNLHLHRPRTALSAPVSNSFWHGLASCKWVKMAESALRRGRLREISG